MSEKIPEWSTVWGAKVKTPTDLPDDILQDTIEISKAILAEETDDNEAIKRIKERMDERWKPNWHVICGRNFGSLVTHEANRCVYFYVEDKLVLIYKA